MPLRGLFMAYRVDKLPYYLYDEDHEDDPTYAIIYFEIPPEHAELIKAIASGSFEPSEPWLGMLERLKEGSGPEVAERLQPAHDCRASPSSRFDYIMQGHTGVLPGASHQGNSCPIGNHKRISAHSRRAYAKGPGSLAPLAPKATWRTGM